MREIDPSGHAVQSCDIKTEDPKYILAKRISQLSYDEFMALECFVKGIEDQENHKPSPKHTEEIMV